MGFKVDKGRYLTLKEFAELSGIKPKAVYKALYADRINGSKLKIRGRWYFHEKCIIIDKRIKTGKYIGIRHWIETGEDRRHL